MIESSNETLLTADYFPLLSIFNDKRSGSIRTEKNKLRQQDSRFYITYRKWQYNPADYLSRHVRSLTFLKKLEKKKSDDLNNLLYTFHVSPVIDATGIKDIAEHNSKDPVLKELRELIKLGKNYTPRNKPNVNHYREILSKKNSVLTIPF